MLKLFQPAPVIDPLPKERVDKEYKKLRLQVFLGIFIGYAGYYLVRKNFSIAMPALEQMGFDKADLGWALSAVSIAYGISKFVMGTVSDHSNARVFIPLGLIASAVIMTVMGLIPWTVSSLSIMLMFCILFVNGWVQGMGWPPCGRVMVHWFSVRERGVKMSIWNIAHNIGGALMAPLAVFGIAIFGVWGGAFYFPAMVAVIYWCVIRLNPVDCRLSNCISRKSVLRHIPPNRKRNSLPKKFCSGMFSIISFCGLSLLPMRLSILYVMVC